MVMQPLQTIIQRFRPPATAAGGVSDALLLERFLGGRDEAAFELLVWRHGPMVLGVCRRILHDAHEAEDAFQATFLTLARKGRSIGQRESISSWLYTVAYRIACRASGRRANRARHEQPLDDLPVVGHEPEPAERLAGEELKPLLDREVSRLPEKYRVAFILCYLEGKTNEEAARQLGCPKGTILSRLARARERLRRSLTQRGVTLGVGPFAVLLAEQVRSLGEVSPVLVNATVQLSVMIPALAALGRLAARRALDLAEEELRAQRLGRLKYLAAAALLLALGVGGAGAATWRMVGPGRAGASAPPVGQCHTK
jgi:RNA polymerase sigma factor (sigma-70 family)